MDFKKLIDEIPAYDHFLTVDEMDASTLKLAEDYPDLVTVTQEGTSRGGHPIYCLKIGDGPKNAFMFGCPHPNEPMGAMMLEYFSRRLCEDEALRRELGYTWYLIKSIDVDGTKLNEGWFKGPFTITNYARNFFRPVGSEQAEWTFPFTYKNYSWTTPIPETQVLMNIIDRVKPEFMYSLHNAGFGGAYWYVSGDEPSLWDGFYKAAEKQNVPLNLGEPEMVYVTQYAPACYKMTGSKDSYDYYEQSMEHPEAMMSCGTSSDDYASQYGTYTLVAELPYFFSRKIVSDTIMPFTRAEAAIKGEQVSHDQIEQIGKILKPVKPWLTEDNPFPKIVLLSVDKNDASTQAQIDYYKKTEAYQQPCKESEAFDCLDITRFYTLLSWGLSVRAINYAIEHTDIDPQLAKTALDQAQAGFDKLAAELENDINYSVVPIRSLIGVQLESGMLVADLLRSK